MDLLIRCGIWKNSPFCPNWCEKSENITKMEKWLKNLGEGVENLRKSVIIFLLVLCVYNLHKGGIDYET